jgi:hypothetical protein
VISRVDLTQPLWGGCKISSRRPPRTAFSKSSRWFTEITALRTARKVIFLGYRFPPTDADARTDILSALVTNETRTAVRIETVLGPRVNSDDSVRLRQLIHVALGTNLIEQVPLYAEDYLLRIAPP